jgi:hypothetical protein
MGDFGNMGIIDPTFGSNLPRKIIMKIVKITHVCLQVTWVLQLTMTNVIDEINGALQLEECQKGAKGFIKTKILQYASQSKMCASLETLVENIKWQTRFIEKITSNCEHVSINPKEKI